ncbi:DUF378 domain-containing protein [Clostridium frigidicarnis]|uniref:DUF378 domain-containing protein n=1 Tax=Clostridium frigidicarnis TaxID=84698 RepID=A0A1I0WL31_9CLOT|nr:DUF378 domain-containing protein [Clostridium frigidicarnis]SFA89311.1 hypothetical protein SAMN04488528_1005168 [Clostridium frigidicarnis]
MYKLNALDKLAMVLVLIGALNWGIIGLLNVDLVGLLFHSIPTLQRVIYILVGVAAIYLLILMLRSRQKLQKK